MRNLGLLAFATLATLFSGTEAAKKCTSIEVRKEWRAFSQAERKAWIGAVNCLNKTPRTGKLNLPVNTTAYAQNDPAVYIPPVNESSSNYDDWVYAHMNLNPIIHWTGLFLPWHRAYLFEWTNDLRSKCGYKGVVPYWAWEQDSANFEGSDIWDTNTEYGLGGFSTNADDDYTVRTGALDITIAYPVTHKLRRRYTPYPFGGGTSPVSAASTFTPAEVEKLLSTPQGNFTAFQGYLEKFVSMHSAIHLIMGGDMGTICPAGTLGTSACPVNPRATWSSNEPMFQLHHANVDRLWWLWQEKSSLSKNAFFGGSVQNLSALSTYPNGQAPWLNKTSPIPSAGMWGKYAIGDTLDTRTWPWCYVYA